MVTKNIWFLPQKKSYVQSCVTVQDKSCMQFLNFFLSKEPISVDSMPICFISNSIMLASALYYLAQQNVAGDLCFKCTALFYVCVSVVLSCFMIILFVQESIKKLIWRNALISTRFFACFVTSLWHTQLWERCSITFSCHFSLLIYGFNFWLLP